MGVAVVVGVRMDVIVFGRVCTWFMRNVASVGVLISHAELPTP